MQDGASVQPNLPASRWTAQSPRQCPDPVTGGTDGTGTPCALGTCYSEPGGSGDCKTSLIEPRWLFSALFGSSPARENILPMGEGGCYPCRPLGEARGVGTLSQGQRGHGQDIMAIVSRVRKHTPCTVLFCFVFLKKSLSLQNKVP